MLKPSASSPSEVFLSDNNPDMMEQGGLPGSNGGFYGELDEIVFLPGAYGGDPHKQGDDGKEMGWQLLARIHYVPEEDSGLKPFYDTQKVSSLEAHIPHTGEDVVQLPADLDELIGLLKNPDDIGAYAGRFAASIGKPKSLNNNSKWAEWLERATASAVAAGVIKEVTEDETGKKVYTEPDGTPIDTRPCDWLLRHGPLRVHADRVPQKERKGLTSKKRGDILVVTEIIPASPKSSAAKKPAPTSGSKPAASKPAPAAGAGKLTMEALDSMVTDLLITTFKGSTHLKNPDFVKAVLSQLQPAQKLSAISWLDPEKKAVEFFTASQVLIYDPEDGMLSVQTE